MVNFLQSRICNSLVAYLTIASFTATLLVPPPLMALDVNAPSLMALDVNAISFGIKMEKIVEKVKKSIDKGETNKIVGYMFDVKQEIEQYTGQKIDINKSIDQAEKEARAKGQKIDQKYIKAIKKEFNRNDKKHKHRAVWFAQCAELDIPYSTIEADAHFDMNYMMARSAKGHDKGEVQIEEVPVTITVGVTIALCGLFLWFVPLPGCQTAGTYLLNTGIGILGSDALARYDAYDREQRKKDK